MSTPHITEKHICTAEDPWTPERGNRSVHPDARETGPQRDGYPGGDWVTYKCPHCGRLFDVELPQ